jgi:hypothetical protein
MVQKKISGDAVLSGFVLTFIFLGFIATELYNSNLFNAPGEDLNGLGLILWAAVSCGLGFTPMFLIMHLRRRFQR